jgi:hypothetical protein
MLRKCSTPLDRALAERALAQAERLQLYDHRAIEDVIQRSNGHRGTKRLAGAIKGDPAWTRGELEARMRRLARDHGLPQPECNTSTPRPPTPRGRLLLPGAPPRHGTDGWDTHRTRQAFESDRAEDAALTAAGYTVVRFTWRQLRDDPQTVSDRIQAILGYRSAIASRNASSSGSSIE